MWVPKAVAVLALGMFVSTSALHAQGAEFSLGGGVDLPLGDFDDVAKLGFHGLAGVSVVPANWPVGIQVDGNYSQFSDDTPLDVRSFSSSTAPPTSSTSSRRPRRAGSVRT